MDGTIAVVVGKKVNSLIDLLENATFFYHFLKT